LIRRLIITHRMSELVEYFKADARFQIVFGIVYGFELIEWRHHIFIGVDLTLFSFDVSVSFCKETRSMIVDVRVQVLLVKFVDERSPTLWNMAIAQDFSDHRSILAFSQGIVIRMA